MVVFSRKNYIVNIVGLCAIVLLVCLLFLSTGAILLALLLLICSLLLLTSYGIAVGRTIIYEEDGCTIKLGKIERKVAWEELAIKRIEPPHLGLRVQYRYGAAFFSLHKTFKPRYCDPCLFCMLFHPFSCFWVYFLQSGIKQSTESTPGIYEVNREDFLKQLNSWGVNLND